MRDVLLTSFTPVLSGGAGLRTFGVLAAMARHRPVDVVYVRFGADAPAPEVAALANVRLQPLEPSRGLRRALAALRAVAVERMPPAFARAVSAELQRAAASAARSAGRVVADGPTVAGALLPLARRRPLVYLAHNLETSFRSHPGLASFERRVLETYAATWMCTEADVEGGRRLAPRAGELRVVPNVVPLPAPLPAPPGERRALLVADFRYPPNAEAARWLLGEVLPRVWRELPDATIELVGRGLEPPADRRVSAPGFVADLRPHYERADAIVVPLLRGGGSPLKLAEGLASGRPVVATTHAAALVEAARPGRDLLAGDDADALAGALVAVLRDGAPEVGRAGRALAERCLGVEALVEVVAS